MTSGCSIALIGLSLIFVASPAVASDPVKPSPAATTASAPNGASAPAQDDDPDRDPNLAQPDFTLAALPTSLRLPRFGSAFRVTHRFARPLGVGDFSDLLEDFFGLDSGAQIGLEYRFGLVSGGQVGVYRTSNRTIQFFAQYDVWSQRDGAPVGITALGAIEGTNNFKDSYSPTLGAVLSREIGEHGALYFEPMWVSNTNSLPADAFEDNDTVMLGLGARVRVRPSVYLFVEASPRVAGYDPGVTQASFGVEKRAGGHVFQLNFSNGFGTTFAQIARGGVSKEDWHIGFNISRRFY